MFITHSYRFLISRRLSSFLTTYRPFTSSVSIYAIHFLRSLRCWVAIIFATWLHVSHMQYSYMTLMSPVPREFTTSLSMSRNAWHSLDLQQPQTKQMEVKKDKKSKGRRTQVKKNRLQYKTGDSNQTQSMIVSGSALSHLGAPRLRVRPSSLRL